MTFELTTAEFSGPIEALLLLIEKRKLPISDVSLSQVTDEYMRFIQGLDKNESIPNRIHFIYVASTLALIKSKSLLPHLELSEEEETDIEKLKERLVLYQQYQEIAQSLGKQYSTKRSFFFAEERPRQVTFEPHESINKKALALLLRDVLKEVPEPVSTKKEGYVKIAVHIEELMTSLLERVKKESSLSFHTFLRQGEPQQDRKHQKVYTVVSFLALLEVIRNHSIGVTQQELFDDIVIMK